jgi:hypothetical protein
VTGKAADTAARLKSVLQTVGIKRAYFVDDAFAPKFIDTFSRSVGVVSAGKGADVKALWGVGDWVAESCDSDNTVAEKKWETLSGPDRSILRGKVDKLAAAPKAEWNLSEDWPRTEYPIECIEPADVTEEFVQKTLIASGPALLLIDLDLGKDDKEGGLRILKLVRAADKGKVLMCVILTQSGGEDPKDATALWDELENKGAESGSAVVISKKSLGKSEQFEGELRRALLNGLCPELGKWVSDVVNKALGECLKKFRIEGDVLNAIVLQSSANEGVHPTETLFRLVDMEFRSLRQNVAFEAAHRAEFETIKKKLEALAKLSAKVEGEGGDEPLTNRVRKLRKKEMYREEGADSWRAAIGLGDLWEITLIKETPKAEGEPPDVSEETMVFVLVAQPCDIILRNNGRRSQDWVFLIPVSLPDEAEKAKKSAEAAGGIDNAAETQVELKYFGRTFENYRVLLKKARIASANVLDLISVAGSTVEAGKIVELKAFPHVHASVAKRMKTIGLWLEKALASANPDRSISLFLDHGPSAKCEVTKDAVKFQAKRIGRLERELSRMVLQRYGDFVARHPTPHDFADRR